MTFPSFESTDYLSARLSENLSVFLSLCRLSFRSSTLCSSVLHSAFLHAVFVFLCSSLTTCPFQTACWFYEDLKEVKQGTPQRAAPSILHIKVCLQVSGRTYVEKKRSMTLFAAPEKAACDLINCLQWCHSWQGWIVGNIGNMFSKRNDPLWIH